MMASASRSMSAVVRGPELIDSRSRLQLGVRGEQDRRPFTLVGRVQYGYGEGVASLDGTWTEWHALFDDGRSGWLSEDNDQYVIAFDRDDNGGAPPFGALEVGQSLRLADSDWRIASICSTEVACATMSLLAAITSDEPRSITTGTVTSGVFSIRRLSLAIIKPALSDE